MTRALISISLSPPEILQVSTVMASQAIPAPLPSNFIATLWKIVGDPNNSNIISWNSSGDCFVVHDADQFLHRVIPRYFRCTMYLSFVRQLHKYGFQRCYPPEMPPSSSAYIHPSFNFYRPGALALIRTEHSKSQEPVGSNIHTPVSAEDQVHLFESVGRLTRAQAELAPRLENLHAHSQEMDGLLADIRHTFGRREQFLTYMAQSVQPQFPYQSEESQSFEFMY
ncbi:winged helix DNA-binding domain-containing protein [Hymenopellis radicata]|nr:winged helix DNA-binding domain-containing protein [Hymenopellis radicata]